jgi:predicted DCC family thiol-disulfide oxidoreductase YuxK
MEERMTVLYDARCSFCRRSKAIGEALDWFRTMRWEAAREAQGSIVVLRNGERLTHWRAVKTMGLHTPLVWLTVLPLLAFLPVFDPIGDRVYGWIARNRYWLSGDSCDRG